MNVPRDEDRKMLPVHDRPAVIGDAAPEGVVEAVAEMGADPNLDLVGYEIPGVGTVTGSAPWSDQYVIVRPHTGAVTTRPAAMVRQHRDSC